MKVLQICAAYKPAYIYGGPTMSVSMLAETLVKTGTYTEVYATTANGASELPVKPNESRVVDGVTVTYFRRITGDHTHLSPALLISLWKRCRLFDVIHIHAWWNLVSIFSCFIALLRGVPVVLSPRGTLSPYSFRNRNSAVKRLIHSMLGRPLLKRTHIHATSDREAAELAVTHIFRTINIIPNFVKFPLPGNSQRKNGKDFRLIFLSRIEEKKGLDILLNALPMLTFSYTLTIVGDGNKNYIDGLKSLAIKNDVHKNIHWTGFQGDNKFALFADHDLLVLPSHDENFGNIIIESLSQGTAVLISPYVGLTTYVTNNNLGWESWLTAIDFGNKINAIYKQRDRLDQIRAGAPAKIQADFDEHSLIEKYIVFYKQIINS